MQHRRNLTADIYSKPTCPFCVKAKRLLEKNNIPFTEMIVGQNATKEDIQDLVDGLGLNVKIRTVPQIFLKYSVLDTDHTEYVGGHDDLVYYLNNGVSPS